MVIKFIRTSRHNLTFKIRIILYSTRRIKLRTLVKARLTRYDKNCPPVIRNPLVLTKAPLTLAGEASEMYNGEVIDAIPTPKPTMPKIRRDGFGAPAIKIAPMKKRQSAIRIALLLPNLSFNQPPIAAPMIAPATAMLSY